MEGKITHQPRHGQESLGSQSSPHHHHLSKEVEKRRLAWVIALTGTMMVLEAVFGWISGSLALLSDAGHMLTHFGALLISLIAIYVARRPSHPRRSYGLYRIEILAALLNASTLLIITVFIFQAAIQRFFHPSPIQTLEMFIIALIGLGVNIASAVLLWRVGQGEDINVRSAFLHMLGDTASSVAVVAGALVIRYTDALWVDPLLSMLICVVILIWAYDLVKHALLILLEATPRHISLPRVETEIQSISGIKAVHDLHIWSITSGMNALTAHIEVSDQLLSSMEQIRQTVESLLLEKFSIAHTNLQFEVHRESPLGLAASSSCSSCCFPKR